MDADPFRPPPIRDAHQDPRPGDTFRVPAANATAKLVVALLPDLTCMLVAQITFANGQHATLSLDVRDPDFAETWKTWEAVPQGGPISNPWSRQQVAPPPRFGESLPAYLASLPLTALGDRAVPAVILAPPGAHHPNRNAAPIEVTDPWIRIKALLAPMQPVTPEPATVDTLLAWLQSEYHAWKADQGAIGDLHARLATAVRDLTVQYACTSAMQNAIAPLQAKATRSTELEGQVQRLQHELEDAKAERDAVTAKLRTMTTATPPPKPIADVIPDDLLKAMLSYVHPDANPDDPKALELTKQINALRDRLRTPKHDPDVGSPYPSSSRWDDSFGRRR